MRARFLAAFSLCHISAVLAVESGVAPLGFTGALSTPVAGSLAEGNMALSYGNYMDGREITNRGHNFLAGVGVLPGVELFARLAANSIHTNCFDPAANCGLRDLSASIKYTLPAAVQPARLSPLLPQVSVGTTDQGGGSNATNFRTYYGVASWRIESVALSAGLAKRDGGRANLSGPFASLVWQPYSWGQAIVEHDGTRPQAGLRFIAAEPALLGDAQVHLDVRTGQPNGLSESGRLGGRSLWYALTLRMPLGGRVAHPASVSSWPVAESAVALALPENEVSFTPVTTPFPEAGRDLMPNTVGRPPSLPSPAPTLVSQVIESRSGDALARAQRLALLLDKAGFQDIRIGIDDKGVWRVRVENQVYAWNDLDALGVALGEVARWSDKGRDVVDLAILRRSLSVFRVGSDGACLARWLQAGAPCGPQRFKTLSATLNDAHVSWLVRDLRPTRWRPRIELSPELHYAVGTEYGALDTDWSLATRVELPVGVPGMVVEGRWLTPIVQSRNFASGGVFAANAANQGLDRALLHQYLMLPADIRAHVAAGRVLGEKDGAYLELDWRSRDGRHAVSWLAGELRSPDSPSRPALLGYRYQFPSGETQLRVQAGEFLDADRGYQLGLRSIFQDTLVTLFYRSTKPIDGTQALPFAGVEVSIPLTPRKNRPFSWGQIAGSADQRQSLQTRVGTVANFLNSRPLGRFGNPPGSLESTVLNRDRTGDDYLMSQLDRLRNAHERYVADVWRFLMPVPSLMRMDAQ